MTERRKIIGRDVKNRNKMAVAASPQGPVLFFLSFRDLGMYIVTIYIHVPRSLKLKKNMIQDLVSLA